MSIKRNAKRLSGRAVALSGRSRSASICVTAAAVVQMALSSHASAVYWNPTTANLNWSGANWNASLTPSVANGNFSNNGVNFSATSYTAATYTSNIDSNFTASTINFLNPGSGTSGTFDTSSLTPVNLTTGNIQVATGDTATFGNSTATNLKIVLSGSSFFDSTGTAGGGTLIVNSAITGAATGNATTLNVQNGTATFNGVIANGAAVGANASTLGLALSGQTTVTTLTNANSYTGSTVLGASNGSSGGTVQLQNAASFGSTSNTVFQNGGSLLTIQLRNDADTAFVTGTIGATGTNNNTTINVDHQSTALPAVTGHTLTLGGVADGSPIAYSFNSSTTTFTNGNSYNLKIGAISLNTITNGGQTFANNMTNGTTTIKSYNASQTSGGINPVTFSVADATATTTIAGAITAATPLFVAVTKTGNGILNLNGASNYSGATTISSGTVKLGNAAALGGTQSSFSSIGTTTSNGQFTLGKQAASVTGGAVLDLGGQTISGQLINLAGTGISNTGALINSSASAATINVGNAIGTLALTGLGTGTTASASPTISVTGTGFSGFAATATIGVGAFTSTGGTSYTVAPTVSVSGGGGTGLTIATGLSGGVVTFAITNPGLGYTSLPSLALVGGTTTGTAATISSTATALKLASINVTNWGTIDPLTFTGAAPTVAITTGLAGAGSSNATITAAPVAVNLTAATSVGGIGDININAPVTGSFGLTKVGGDTVTLGGQSIYIGGTTISTGKLFVNNGLTTTGSATGSGAISVASGATLGGSGRIATTGTNGISVSGILSPGATEGTADAPLVVSLGTGGTLDLSTTVLNNSGELKFDLATVSGSDKVDLSSNSAGILNIGSGMQWSDFAFTPTTGFGLGTYVLFDTAHNLGGTLASIGSLSGIIGGFNAHLSYANGASLLTSPTTAQDVVLVVDSAVPEPASLSVLAVGAVAVLSRRRRAIAQQS